MKNMMLWIIFTMAICNQQVLASEHGEKDKDMTIDIVISAKAQEPVKFAASELSGYLIRITGSEAPCVAKDPILLAKKGQPSVAESGKGLFLVAVSTDESVPAGIRERLKGHGAEAFVVESNGDRLLLIGNSPRAVVYAVYHLLEKHIGCRWFTYDPAEEIVPQKSMAEIKTLIKNGIKDFEEPHFAVRMMQYYTYEIGPQGTPLANEIVKSWPQLIQWMAKLRLNIFQFDFSHTVNCIGLWESFRSSNAIVELRRRGIELGAGGHMPNLLFMTRQDFKDHPDWRPFYKGERQNSGQFCTCNPDAREHYLKGIMAFLKANPEITYLGLYPNDRGGWCECPLCAGTRAMDRNMQLYNLLAQRIHNETPDMRLSYFAYGSTAGLPTNEKPFPGMMVNYAPWGRDYSVPIEDSKRFHDRFIKWRDYCRQSGTGLILHEKYIRQEYMGLHIMPMPTLQQDMKFYRKEGAVGFEQATEHAGWWIKSPNCYVLSHLMWNSDENAQALTDDFFAQFYGSYAKEMAESYALVESAMDYKYGGNKWLFGVPASLTNDSAKVANVISITLPFAERARERLEQALQRVRKLQERSVNPVYSSRMDRLEIVFDYSLQEVSAEHEICLGVAAMEKGRAFVSSDPTACRKQLDIASEHFQAAAKFDLVRKNYAQKMELLAFQWNGGDYYKTYDRSIISQFQDMVAKMKNEASPNK